MKFSNDIFLNKMGFSFSLKQMLQRFGHCTMKIVKPHSMNDTKSAKETSSTNPGIPIGCVNVPKVIKCNVRVVPELEILTTFLDLTLNFVTLIQWFLNFLAKLQF